MPEKTNSNKAGKQQPLKPRRVPERSCIACKSTRQKRELIMIVKTENGIEVDPTGKKNGRGAYLCADIACWQIGLKGNRIERALNGRLSQTNRQSLIEYGKNLAKQN
jgi:uncharacterized protein